MSDRLCDGPRGRRLLLELARTADADITRELWDLSYNAAVRAGHAVVRLWVDENGGASCKSTREPVPVTHSAAQVAARIRSLDRLDPTVDDLDEALRRAVDSAAYWQSPDGDDLVAAEPVVRAALCAVGADVPARADAAWWHRARTSEQWAVEFDPIADGAPFDAAPEAAARSTEGAVAEEIRAKAERPADPTVRWSGTWWSHPYGAPHTTGERFDGTPAGIPYLEDGFGSTRAVAIPVRGGGRTYEIRGAEDWTELCRRFPLEVTASRRHDWYRVTGRDGRWVLPDWGKVAAEWDAVHLTGWAYLTAATRELPVDDDFSSLIGGWGPDQTYWLTGLVREVEGGRVHWQTDAPESPWERVG